MKRNAIRSLVVMMIAVMVFALTPVPVSAASKAPAKVKISSVKVAAVSKTTNKTTVTIKWKTAKRAKGYIVWVKHGTGQWVQQIRLGKRYRKLKLMNVPAGQFEVKVQAVNKKKLGKFSNVKSKFIVSPMTLADYANRVEPSMKNGGKGVTVSFSGNTITYTCDVSGEINSIDEATAAINANAPNLKNAAQKIIDAARLDAGISGVTVVYKYVYNGNSNLLPSFTFR